MPWAEMCLSAAAATTFYLAHWNRLRQHECNHIKYSMSFDVEPLRSNLISSSRIFGKIYSKVFISPFSSFRFCTRKTRVRNGLVWLALVFSLFWIFYSLLFLAKRSSKPNEKKRTRSEWNWKRGKEIQQITWQRNI